MKNFFYIFVLTAFAVMGCQTVETNSRSAWEGCSNRDIASPCESFYKSANSRRTLWGFHEILPLKQNPEQIHRHRKSLNLDSVGAVYTKTRPFRASAFYLGSIPDHTGKKRHYFGISAHVTDRLPYSVEFGHLSSEQGTFRVDLNSEPIYYSVASDIGILSASQVPPHIEARLNDLKPFSFITSPLERITAANSNMEYFVAGRILPAALENASNKFAGYRDGMWTEQMRRQIEASAVEMATTHDERARFLDLPRNHSVDPNSAGDLFYFTQTTVLAGGISIRMKDPDGLVPGKTGEPFLPSDTSWNPYSLAVPMVLNGRASGSPLVTKVGDQVALAGVMWTMGVAENINQRIPQINELHQQLRSASGKTQKDEIQKKIEELLFGDIRAVADSADPSKLIIEIVNGKTAPFAYASAAYRAAYELKILSRSGRRNREEKKILSQLQRGQRDSTDIEFIRQFLKRSDKITQQMLSENKSSPD